MSDGAAEIGVQPELLDAAPAVDVGEQSGGDVQRESAKAIAELTAKVATEEHDRLKGLDTKAGVLIGVVVTAIVLVLGTIARAPDAITKPPASLRIVSPQVIVGVIYVDAVALYVVAVAASLVLLLTAGYWFMQAIRVEEFKQIDPKDWANDQAVRDSPEDTYVAMAGTYGKLIAKNKQTINKKGKMQRRGLHCLAWATLALVVCVPIALIVTTILDILTAA